MILAKPEYVRAYFIEAWRSGVKGEDGKVVDVYEVVRILFNFGFRGVGLNLLAR